MIISEKIDNEIDTSDDSILIMTIFQNLITIQNNGKYFDLTIFIDND